MTGIHGSAWIFLISTRNAVAPDRALHTRRYPMNSTRTIAAASLMGAFAMAAAFAGPAGAANKITMMKKPVTVAQMLGMEKCYDVDLDHQNDCRAGHVSRPG